MVPATPSQQAKALELNDSDMAAFGEKVRRRVISAALKRIAPSLCLIGGDVVGWKEEQRAMSHAFESGFRAPPGGERCMLLERLVDGARKLVMGDAEADEPQVVLLEGEPGSGKSAIMSQLGLELQSDRVFASSDQGRRVAQGPIEEGSDCVCISVLRQSRHTYSQILQCLTQQAFLKTTGSLIPRGHAAGWEGLSAALLEARKASGKRLVVIVDGLSFNEAVHFIWEAANECSFKRVDQGGETVLSCPLKRRVWFCVSSCPPSPDRHLSAVWRDGKWMSKAFPSERGGALERYEGETIEDYTQRLVGLPRPTPSRPNSSKQEPLHAKPQTLNPKQQTTNNNFCTLNPKSQTPNNNLCTPNPKQQPLHVRAAPHAILSTMDPDPESQSMT
jgi:hypothetical protein